MGSSNILNNVLKNISELFILKFVHKKFEVQKISMSQISESWISRSNMAGSSIYFHLLFFSTIHHKHDAVLFLFKKCINFKCRHCIVGIAIS